MTNEKNEEAPAVELVEDDLDTVVGGLFIIDTKGVREGHQRIEKAAFDGKGNDLSKVKEGRALESRLDTKSLKLDDFGAK